MKDINKGNCSRVLEEKKRRGDKGEEMVGKMLCRLMNRSYNIVKPSPSFYSFIPLITTTLPSESQISPTISPKISPVQLIRPFSALIKVPYPEFGLDYKHWFIQVKDPEPRMTRDQIIEMYVKMLASSVGWYAFIYIIFNSLFLQFFLKY